MSEKNNEFNFDFDIDLSRYDFTTETKYKMLIPGLNKKVVEEISFAKDEPEWMRKIRLKGLELFEKLPMPGFGPDLSDLDTSKIVTYARPDAPKTISWEEVPEEIKEAFDKIGVPEAERKYLAGSAAQFDSEVVYEHLKEKLNKLGVIFLDMDTAVKEYPEIVKKYFMKIVPIHLHKFSALQTALWSGGVFLYVPKGVKVDLPLQGYFRTNSPGVGQFEHTIIILEDGAEATYIEGCSAPTYKITNLHAGVVEIYVGKEAKLKFITIQNWSKNTYNLGTKRAIVEDNGTIEYITASVGSGKTMVYPAAILKGKNSTANVLKISIAGPGQHIEGGTKIYHIGENTKSVVDARSIALGGGWAIYRGLLRIEKSAKGAKATVNCSSMMLDNNSRSDSIPLIESYTDDADIGYEAKIGRISEDQIYYLQSRGLNEDEAKAMIVRGFLEPIIKEMPFEYAIELNRLINLEIESSIG